MQEHKSKGQGLQWSINLLFLPTSFLICCPISERVPCLKCLFVLVVLLVLLILFVSDLQLVFN